MPWALDKTMKIKDVEVGLSWTSSGHIVQRPQRAKLLKARGVFGVGIISDKDMLAGLMPRAAQALAYRLCREEERIRLVCAQEVVDHVMG